MEGEEGRLSLVVDAMDGSMALDRGRGRRCGIVEAPDEKARHRQGLVCWKLCSGMIWRDPTGYS